MGDGSGVVGLELTSSGLLFFPLGFLLGLSVPPFRSILLRALVPESLGIRKK